MKHLKNHAITRETIHTLLTELDGDNVLVVYEDDHQKFIKTELSEAVELIEDVEQCQISIYKKKERIGGLYFVTDDGAIQLYDWALGAIDSAMERTGLAERWREIDA